MKFLYQINLSILLFISSAGNLYSQQWGNYTLYSVMNSTSAYLIDTNGNTFHTWNFASNAKTGYSTYMMPGGTLVRTVAKSGNSFTGGPICGQVQKVDYNGTVIWDFVYSTSNYCSHHDICPMPNGNVLLIAYEVKTPAQVTQAGSSMAITMWPDKIVEIQPTGPTTGIVVWEWHAWDHLVQNVDPTKDNYYPSISDHPELLNINYQTQKDWLHMNGVDYNPILDQITWSSHNTDEVYIIDHSTTTAEAAGHTGGNSGKGGDILYRWGNPAAYNAPGTHVIDVVHDAHWIPEGVPDAGRLVGFNNRGVSFNQSAVDQIETPVNGYNYNHTPGTSYLPSTYTERHACSGYTSNMGNSQQLPNGNMLVCMATAGLIYEIDTIGTTLWSKSLTGFCAQAFRYDSCYTFNPAPAIPVIALNGNDLDAGSAASYQWYLNGVLIPGATGQTFTPVQNGVYVVRITDTNGCVFQYSPGFTYPSTSGIADFSTVNSFRVFPNPSSEGIIQIDPSPAFPAVYEIRVTDATGKLILKQSNSKTIDLTFAENGLYFIHAIASGLQPAVQKLSLNK